MAPRAGEPTTERNAPSPRAGAGSGEVAEPASSEPQPAKPYPIDPAVCDHRTSAGRWVKWVTANVHDFSGVADGTGPTITPQLVCPKCGTPMLVAMEGTNADLGPA